MKSIGTAGMLVLRVERIAFQTYSDMALSRQSLNKEQFKNV